MKKKTAIVSCYFQHNYGSMLQAYATQKALDKLGYDNETIDISGFSKEIRNEKIKYFIKASLSSDILFSKLGRAFNEIRKKISGKPYVQSMRIRDDKFTEFCKKYFRLSPKYKSKQALGAACNERYSNVLVGSDQLWLPANIAADYYTLNFVPRSVNTIAYATSFGQSVLPKETKQKAKVFLERIRHLSVREETGQKLIKQIVNRDVPIVCDPTLLFTGDEWLSVQPEQPIVGGRYIFCYFLGNNPPHRQFASRLAKETGCRIVALTHLDEFVQSDVDYADLTPYDIGPADFINLVRNAEYVCTDSFHCSVFSILYKKTFFAFRRYVRKTKQSTNSRLDTLFYLTGMDGRIFNGNEDIKNVLRKGIDYSAVDDRLSAIRDYSYDYLRKSLENSDNTDIK